MQKSNEQIKEIERQRRERALKLSEDPYIGYPSIDAALKDYKCSTQAEVLARLLDRQNVFISGLAGAGKSTVIKRFFDIIDSEHSGAFQLALTASTGIAATLIGGRTVHSWSGLGLGTEPFTGNSKELKGTFWSRLNDLKAVDVLVIDEISMLPAYFFINIDKMLKYVKRNKEPFGGVQLILTGDFLQLPPVQKNSDNDLDCRFAIETDEWKEADIKCCFMDKSYRATDERMKTLLREISIGKVSEKTKEEISKRFDIEPDETNKVYTTLFTTNANVDKFNQEKLEQEPSSLIKIKAEESGSAKNIQEIYKKYGILPELELKSGATVILTKNYPGNSKLANGSVGKIISISQDMVVVKFNNGEVSPIYKIAYELKEKKDFVDQQGKKTTYEITTAVVRQVPLKLGYAITVHKSQGQTFDGVIVDLSKCFQDGLGYVALSRVRNMDDLIIRGFDNRAYKVSEKSKKITRMVKTKALKNRYDFIENLPYYDMLLTNHLLRKGIWDKDGRLPDHERNNNV